MSKLGAVPLVAAARGGQTGAVRAMMQAGYPTEVQVRRRQGYS